jgi:leucyl-tRNA synthetase
VYSDVIVEQYGGDAMRLYEMFMGPLEAVKPWQTQQIAGVVRFQSRVFALARRAAPDAPLAAETERLMHQTIRKVTGDIESLSFNTAISQLMVFSNHLRGLAALPVEPLANLVLLLSPLAPHLCEEAWQTIGREGSLAYEPWPAHDDALCEEATLTLAVQVNGKVRGEIDLPKGAAEPLAREAALAHPKVLASMGGKPVKRFVYVPGRIVNVVV